jgi:pimeloyl-ACP methyl ester carboxylesterase
MVAFCLAGKYPEVVKRVVAIGSPYKRVHRDFQDELNRMAEMAQRGIPWAPNEHHLTVEQKLYSFDPEVTDAYRGLIASVYQEWPTGVFLDLKSFNHSTYIPHIVAPTLLLNGAFEYVVDPEDALCCLHDLGAKQKGLMVVGNAFHLVFLEEVAHRIFYHAVLGWLFHDV